MRDLWLQRVDPKTKAVCTFGCGSGDNNMEALKRIRNAGGTVGTETRTSGNA